MGIRCLLYVSESCLAWPDDAHEVDDIVTNARARNEQLGVTGALIYTRTHFAQVLEGETAAIDAVMTSIRADARHRNLCVVADEALATRHFPDWTMAYSGPSFYVDRQIRPLLTDATDPARRRRAGAVLLAFIREFAADSKRESG
ncbi:MAG: BLUF domain-containing protein [Alphaproteobacteria bacterium]|nr:BLUF domain-containing protein [Alphaproteobacteria bacterium]